jgi:hemerythrin
VAERTRALSESNRELVELIGKLETEKDASWKLSRALAEANRRLEDMAMTDVLTGLPNRRHALSWLDREWAKPHDPEAPLACLMIDADGLKEVNDRHGHDAGDALLRGLAAEFRNLVRTDDVVCRLGGDEFLVLCPGTPLEGVLRVGETLRREVARQGIPTGDGVWRGSISVGAAVRVEAMADPDALIKAADEAVYAAKERGGDHVAAAPLPNPADGPEGKPRRRSRRKR